MSNPTGYRRTVLERNGKHCQVVLTAEAHEILRKLMAYHRLTQREVVERLILGLPLGGSGGTEQQQLGMSDPEYAAFEAHRRSVQTSGQEL